MRKVKKDLDKNAKSKNIQMRPFASHGIWLSGLLFAAFLQTIFRSSGTVTLHYEISTVLLFGMFLQTLEVFISLTRENLNHVVNATAKLLPSIATCLLFVLSAKQEVFYSAITSIAIMSIYRFSYLQTMKALPLSFTLGEASIVIQAFVVFIYNCYLKLPFMEQAKSTDEISLVLQIGLLAVTVIVLGTYTIPLFRKWPFFYLLLTLIVLAISSISVHAKPAITILLNFIFSDIERVSVVGVYLALLTAAGFAVNWQISKNQKGSTSTRKIFHILIVLVFVPGLIFQCQFLYVVSAVTLAIFIVLEVARVIELTPVAEILETSIAAFIDKKDAGKVALTPIYLLVGCAAPMWIHNSPCDLTGSSASELLPLLSGVLSIGIGDTFASVVGSKIGKHKWPKSDKSVEGTVAGMIAQVLFIYALVVLGYLPLSARLMAISGIAVIVNGLVEALTDQVDNLVLPILTYAVLSFK